MSPISSDPRRAALYARLRRALDDGTSQRARAEAVAQRLAAPPTHLLPARTGGTPAECRAMLTGYLQGQSATVVDVVDAAGVPAAVAQFLRQSNLPLGVRMGADERLAGLPWAREPALTTDVGAATARDEVGLSYALSGVAETGTLVLASGQANPVTLNYLPETHIVVLDARDIVGGYEQAFDGVRSALGRTVMPRTLNFVSGPSRTGDIGGRLVMGAHGPRRMCVIIVG